MCGIVAIWGHHPAAPSVDPQELRIIRDYMANRGPDGKGEWYSPDKKIGLGHRRLSILDLSDKGSQPMVSRNQQFVISFNGEIYNYRQLRTGLQQKGYQFSSDSDTEVLLYLYQEYGRKMLPLLRGMFAFAIWDEKKKGLLLARDPFGIKPLYYADDGKTIRVASQVKALLAGGKIDTTPEPAGHAGFFLWGHVPEPYTFYKGIRSLPAGSTLWSDHTGKHDLQSFCNISDILSSAETDNSFSVYDKGEVQKYLRDALLDSVKHHLTSDVPVGIFLSSGLDSTTLLALASEVSSKPIYTITLGFLEYKGTENDETLLAERVAERYGAKHQTVWVSKEEFQAERDRILTAMDQPTTDGINTYFVSKVAAQTGLKVALSGVGGDELFGGYPSFKQIPKLVHALRPAKLIPGFGKAFRLFTVPLLKHFTSPKYAGTLEFGTSFSGAYLLRRSLFMPWELSGLMGSKMVREGLEEFQTIPCIEKTIQGVKTDHSRISALELTWYMRNQLLRDADWAGMAHSLEIRTPLVDIELLKKVAPLFLTDKVPEKLDMAETPFKKLPEEILNRKKTGFSIPVHEWLLKEKGAKKTERKLRGWAKNLYTKNRKQNILVLATDAFGGIGGIAKYNRDLLTALCSDSNCEKIVAVPRLMPHASDSLPEKLIYVTEGINSKIKYVSTILKILRNNSNFDLIICSHIHLLPVAYMVHLCTRSPIMLIIYGIEAWKPPRSHLINFYLQKINSFVSISDITKQNFLNWSKLDNIPNYILPNAIDFKFYGHGDKKMELLNRYHLTGKNILMTMGRIESSEKYKGFDEVLEVLPELLKENSNICYLIVGDGNDRKRLENKAIKLGVKDHVVFAGYISEKEKADHFRLADVYIMPSRGEGFGFVFLEAMACGVPVIASKIDGGREAVRNGELGIVVDPKKLEEIKKGICEVLNSPKKRGVPQGLEYFSYCNFENRTHRILDQVLINV